MSSLAMAFRTPIVFVNLSAIEYILTSNQNIISIPKKLWLKNESRYLTFNEIFNNGIGRFLKSKKYEEFGIELVENTPEEILDVAIEMHERLNGNWKDMQDERVLQEKFWDLFPKSDLHNHELLSRIGAKFLIDNKYLLRN